MGRVQKPKLLRCTWPQHASTEMSIENSWNVHWMCWKCVGNVLEMCPLKLILASWKGLGMQWFVYECVLAGYVSIKFLKFPTWTGWHTVTYGDIWWLWGSQFTERSVLSTEESTSPESDSGHLISLIPVADFVFEANLLPNLLQLYFNCMKERERERERERHELPPGVPSVLHRRMPMEDSSSLGEI